MRIPYLGMLSLSCAAAAQPPAQPRSATCASPEHRQLDFWIGDWDVTVKTQGKEAKGRQHVEAILGGCAIAESFTAEGPQQPWAGRSYSSWQPALGKWRQTWVDDSGGYLAFTGGLEQGTMALYGEPRTGQDGKAFQMRMVFLDVTPDALRWEWQRSYDEWKTRTVMMAIDYRRRR
jgi:uncharacterized protein DUF1579